MTQSMNLLFGAVEHGFCTRIEKSVCVVEVRERCASPRPLWRAPSKAFGIAQLGRWASMSSLLSVEPQRKNNSNLGGISSMRPEQIEQLEVEESAEDLSLTPQNDREEGSESLESSFRISTRSAETREKVDSDFFNEFDDDFDESDMIKPSL